MTDCPLAIINGHWTCPQCGWTYSRIGPRRPPRRSCPTTRDEAPREPPPLARQAWNLATSLAAFVADGCHTVDEGEYRQRLEICDVCDSRRGNRCMQCGCNLAMKAVGRAFHCPSAKW